MNILFIVPYPTEGASNRFRVEQYLPYLRRENVEYKLRPFMSRRFYKIIYSKGNYLRKIFYFIISTINRLFDILRALRSNLIFVHREAFPIGPPLIERIFHLLKKPIIYDFDDAIFLPNTSPSNPFIERFKRPKKVQQIIHMSRYVIAGNRYLRDFALRYNKNVTVIPSSIDTQIYRSKEERNPKNKIIIGWIGSNTTAHFLKMLENVFRKLDEKYTGLEFRLMGGEFYVKDFPRLVCRPWSLEREVKELQDFDIGIMPMPDNDWTRGKCGFKAILYMSVGIPCVCSPVGVNKEIIEDGVNGFLADSEDEWIEKLSLLIESPVLRRRIGVTGRKTVEERYSVKVNAPKFLEVIQRTYEEN